jgi:hypothetical protein
MYYNRTLNKKDEFSKLLKPKGELRWLFNYVKGRCDLDFLIGKSGNNQWISVYRGLSRILTITPVYKNPSKIKIDAANAYKELAPNIYGTKDLSDDFKDELDKLISIVEENEKFDRYYKNKKEGFYQNELSRRYGMFGLEDDEFVIVDKEAVIGYTDIAEKNKVYGKLQEGYKELQKAILDWDAKEYGQNLDKKSIGNELDFLALDKEGNILLIEYKHGTNTSGIYLSPLQIGMYYDLFNGYPKEELHNSINAMLKQKQEMGLINSDWKIPKIKDIIPVLIISDYKDRSSSKRKYHEILKFVRGRKGNEFLSKIRTYNYTTQGGLEQW